ncbi:hypothetical protein B0T10DRAFT_466200 [Thelonectria olida]|uniref:Uncharacterized protein n=1 Tax=Thelonectria olida TaxID=1576542 RepID=A0A9P8VQE2_9HYPO|nr:hypothetical protein B0T10DRAFT_466200 [Thelonectria olida]
MSTSCRTVRAFQPRYTVACCASWEETRLRVPEKAARVRFLLREAWRHVAFCFAFSSILVVAYWGNYFHYSVRWSYGFDSSITSKPVATVTGNGSIDKIEAKKSEVLWIIAPTCKRPQT